MLDRRRFTCLAVGVAFSAPAWSQQTSAASYIPNHPLFTSSLEALKQNRWHDLVASISALPPQAAYTLLNDIGDRSPIGDNLNELARVKGGQTIAGAIQIGWAWRFRGAEVEINDEAGFERHLVKAADSLIDALRNDPDDGLAATFLFRVFKGVGDADVLHEVLPKYLAAKRKPVQGLSAYADAVSAKWAGSEAESLSFARRYAGSQPAASYGVIPDTHLTTASARSISDDPKVASTADSYFGQPEVDSEIVAAHDAFLAAAAHADPFAMLLANSQFSLAFLQMNDAVRARVHLSAQGLYAGGPWRGFDDPASMIGEVRAAFGLDSI